MPKLTPSGDKGQNSYSPEKQWGNPREGYIDAKGVTAESEVIWVQFHGNEDRNEKHHAPGSQDGECPPTAPPSARYDSQRTEGSNDRKPIVAAYTLTAQSEQPPFVRRSIECAADCGQPKRRRHQRKDPDRNLRYFFRHHSDPMIFLKV